MTGETKFHPRIEQVRVALLEDLPPVTLLLGGDYIAYGVLAEEVRHHYGIGAPDMTMTRQPFTADDARALVSLAPLVPFSPFRLVAIVLDGASEAAQNILLKLLEEPPPHLRVILLATGPPLPTIVSRSRVFDVGAGHVMSPEGPSREVQAKVSAAVRAAESGQHEMLLAACADWDADCITGLREWAVSQAWSHRPELSGREPLEPKVSVRQARRVLRGLSMYPRARPVNAAVTALTLAFSDDDDR